MIHQLIFAYPKPGMTAKEFQEYWVQEHAVRYASKIPQVVRYCVNTRVPLPDEDAEPLWEGVAEIWLRNEEEQLASLQTPEFLQGARLDEPKWAAFWRTLVLDTDTHVLLGNDEPQPSGGFKVIYLTKRREGLPLEYFRAQCLTDVASAAVRLPGLQRYEQCHTRDALYGVGEAMLDAAHLLWFENVEAFAEAKRSPEYADTLAWLRAIGEDRYLHTMAVQENWITGP